MKLLACVCIVAAFCVAEPIQATPFQKCKKGPAPLELRVDGCTQLPCKLVRGEDVTGEWDFVVTADTKALKPVVKATAMGITVNYPLPEQNACKNLVNGECPLDKGEEVTYSLTMPVSKFYPKVAVVIEFNLVDDNGDPQVCFVLPTQVA